MRYAQPEIAVMLAYPDKREQHHETYARNEIGIYHRKLGHVFNQHAAAFFHGVHAYGRKRAYYGGGHSRDHRYAQRYPQRVHDGGVIYKLLVPLEGKARPVAHGL